MDILSEILETKKEEVKSLKRKYSISSFEGMEFLNNPNLGFKKNLEANNHL